MKRPFAAIAPLLLACPVFASDVVVPPASYQNARNPITEAASLGESARIKDRAHDALGAWADARQALELSPDDGLLLRDFAYYSFDARRYRDVIWACERLDADPALRWMLTNASLLCWVSAAAGLGEPLHALRVTEKALERHPSDGTFVRWKIALTYATTSEPDPFKTAQKLVTENAAILGVADTSDGYETWAVLRRVLGSMLGLAQKSGGLYATMQNLGPLHALHVDARHRVEWDAPNRAILENALWELERVAIDTARRLPLAVVPPARAREAADRAHTAIDKDGLDGAASAVREWTKAVAWAPGWAEAHFNLAAAAEEVGAKRFDDQTGLQLAAWHYQIYLMLAPNGVRAAEARAALSRWGIKERA